jgi:uncharacterized RDD family membrane protein YckC
MFGEKKHLECDKNLLTMKRQTASFFRRLIAYLIDTLPITIVITSIAMIFFGFGSSVESFLKDPTDFSARKDFQLETQIISSICTIIWIIYCIIMETSAQQGTFGKKLMNIKVVDANGKKLTFEQAFKRNTTKVASMLILHIGFVWMIFDPQRQTWHDKFGEAYVVDNEQIK